MVSAASIYEDLCYDSPKMELGLAEKYFKDQSSCFQSWVDGMYYDIRSDDPYVEDNANNRIYTYNPKSPSNSPSKKTEWADETANMKKVIVLNKIATLIESNSELFAQIDYVLRKVQPAETKRFDIKSMGEYFRYYANLIPLKKTGPDSPIADKLEFTFHNGSPLASLGWVCAGALAAGGRVVVYCFQHVAAITILFATLCHQAGLPVGTINVILQSEPELGPDSVTVNHEKGCTCVVTESADLDSATDVVTSALWSHNGMLPWKIQVVLVQESVYESFKLKFLNKIQTSTNTYEFTENQKVIRKSKAEKVLKYIESRGIDYFKYDCENVDSIEKPIILLDSVTPNWFNEIDMSIPVISVQAYRTTKELVTILNKEPSLALSLWSCNNSVSNEITFGTNVGCVWINSYNIVHPVAPLAGRTIPGCNAIGGKDGLIKHWNFKASKDPSHFGHKAVLPSVISKSVSLESCVQSVKKLSSSWQRTESKKRASLVQSIAELLHVDTQYYIQQQVTMFGQTPDNAKLLLEECIEHILHVASISLDNKLSFSSVVDQKLCLVLREPLGLIFINSSRDTLVDFLYCCVPAIAYGNAVIYATKSSLVSEFATRLNSLGLPIVPYVYENDAEIHKLPKNSNEINILWYLSEDNKRTVVTHISDGENTQIVWTNNLNDLETLFSHPDVLEYRFSHPKTVWSPFGETFAN